MPGVVVDVRSVAGVDLLSLDGRLAVRCSNTTLPYKEVKRFTRVARWIYKAANFNSLVLVTVPLLALLDQFAVDFPGLCKVGTHHNKKIDFDAKGFIAVTQSVHLLQKLKFNTILVDEAHHPLPKKLPKAKELFQFSATLEGEKGVDFQYTMGKAIEDGVLCDYDITVPAITAHHAYVCLAGLLMKQAGRFRRVLAYCNTVAEAKRFQMVLKELGLAAWHINSMTGWKERKRVMDVFTGVLKKPVHVLVTVEVLGEGINIPNADTCMFVEPRNSYRSIIQAIGRILRHHQSKPLGHIILPAVAVPKQGPDHVPVPPSSEESKKQTKNCKEQSVSQETHVSCSLTEPPGCRAGQEHKADISLIENLEAGEGIRTPQSRRACDQSSDAIAKTVQGAETMGNGPVSSRELLDAQQEQTSNKQQLGSVSSEQGRTKHKQFTMNAGSRASAAVQFQMLPESRTIGSSSRTNPLSNSGGQTGGKSQEGGGVKSRTADNSGTQSHETLEGKELETSVMEGNKMEIRYKRRVKLHSLEGVGSSGQEYQSQLDRFLAKLMQADERLIGSSARHRIQVVDCRIGVAEEVGMDAATNAIYGRLTALLMQTDPWEMRFESLEKFVRTYQRFPSKLSKDNFEARLGNWWSNQLTSFNLGRLPAHRLQRLRWAAVALIRQRVGKWMAGGHKATFRQHFRDLQRHFETYNQLPSCNSRDPKTRKLGTWLWKMRHSLPRSRVKDINVLKAVHPLVEQLFQWDMRPIKIKERVWSRKLEELSTFISQYGRLPRPGSERGLHDWLWRQRSRICMGNLPEKFVAALQDAHPLLSEAVAIAESDSLNMRSLDERDAAFMERLRNLAHEALSWPHLNGQQRLMWATVLELDVVPLQEQHPSGAGCSSQSKGAASLISLTLVFNACLPGVVLVVGSLAGVDLLSLDGSHAVRCSNATLPYQEVKRFIRVLITVPLRALLDQFAQDFPGFCKVGTRHNKKIDLDARGFIAVTKSVYLLQKLTFNTILVDEAHHPLPKKLPKAKELFQFSATLEEEGIDFQYTMGKAIEDGVLCDYDITVPAVTAHHAYVCLADLLVKQAGRFRRVLAYCNAVAEAKRFQMVLRELGLAAWHINAATGWKERKRVMDEFTGILLKPVHVLVTVEVLGEGINIPNADTCMFVEPRNSYRSIIQAIGRILRHHLDKPLGHIILPAVAVPERGPDHVPVPPSSEESKKQTKNCKEQSVSQKTHASRSLTELPGCTGVTRDDSRDANQKTWRGAETMGNGQDRTELLQEPQEHQPPSNQRQGSVSSKQSRTKHKQFTMNAGSRASAAVQFQMLPESQIIGSSSRTNPLATSGGQTVGKSQEGGRVKSCTAEMNSGLQNHKTLEGKELESNVTDGNKMGIRYNRRVKLQSLEGVGSSGQGYQSQLERFLAKLMQADERLVGSSAGHRIQVVDCRIGLGGEVGMDAATNAIYGNLTAFLMQTDPWQARFESLEEFVRMHQALPRKLCKDPLEASLGNWLSNQRTSLKLGRLPAHKLQRLQSASSTLIRQRVAKWLVGGHEAAFKQRCRDLQRHMQKHNQLPSRGSPDPETRKLCYWLWNVRRKMPRSRVKEISWLKTLHPLVKQLLQWDTQPVKIKEALWFRKLKELSLDERDAAFMERLRNLAHEALSWPHLNGQQRLMWATVLELDVVPFDAVFVDEAHHPLPPKLPKGKELFQFSATLEQEEGIDFQYTMGKAIKDGVLCDYDITVPAVTAHHAYVCLADLLLKQAGRFRRVLAYCNTVAEAKRFQMVLKELGLAAWHINAETKWKERKRVMDEFTGILKKPVHVLVTVEVLGEGINIPNADTCMFVEPRNSYRSIIQAIGRILRHHAAKPLGHIILPAVAIPKQGPDHVPVPPTSAELELRQQKKNCKEQSLSQSTHASRSLAELPGWPDFQEHEADISLIDTCKDSRTRQSRGVWDESSDANEETVQGAETMGNGPVTGREFLHAPDEYQTSNGQRQGSVWSEKGRPQHKQGTMTAGSLAGAAVQSQMLPESRAIGFSSRTNPLVTSARQTVGRSQEGGRLKSCTAEMNSGPQNHKTPEGKELESNVTDGNKMGIRYNRRVKLQSLEGVGSSGQGYQSQLERFLAKLMQADERLVGSSAGHRIQVVDCRIGLGGEVGMDAATNAIYGNLTAFLRQTDPWQARFESLEEFVLMHQRFPNKGNMDSSPEVSLASWWGNQHAALKLGQLPAHRLQRLQSSSVALIRQRVEKWLAGGRDAIFRQRCQDLQRHLETHNEQLPSRNSPDPEARKLGNWLKNLRRGLPRSRVKDINSFEADLVKQVLQSETYRVKIDETLWRTLGVPNSSMRKPMFLAIRRLDERDAAFMERLRNLAHEALSWTHLKGQRRLMWATVLELDVVPVQERHPSDRKYPQGLVSGGAGCPSLSKGAASLVLITVPLHALLDQFAVDFPGFCKVGMGHNERIDFDANGFIAVTQSAHLLQKLRFDAVFVDEAHHPMPPKLPKAKELFQFSATLEEEKGIDFQYTMGKAIEDGVLCDYDITVPAVTAHHAYVCLADLLVKQAGRFRRVLAYCNTVAEAKRFQMVLSELGLAAWHINAKTGRTERKRVMDEFTGVLKKPVHVLVTVEVLGEGINIPDADTCMFVEPRNSYRSIIQAIGRILRHHPAKPLGHIILPAVAVPKQGPDHVPVPPSSEESKQQTKNCKEQSLSQKTPVSRSLAELPGCPGGQEHSADISVPENLQTGEAVRTRHNTGVRDDSSDANEETGQGGETMGNVPVRRELLDAPEDQKSSNPLTTPGGQTVPRSQEGGRVKGRTHTAEMSGTQSYKTFEGEELETNVTDWSKMGIPSITRNRRVRLQSAEGVSSSGHEYQTQLDRFLAKLMQADERLIGSSAGHRIQVVDCRIGVTGEVGMDAATNAMYGRLTALLMQTDPWEVRFESLEEFVRMYRRLPRQYCKRSSYFETSLGNWWSHQNRNRKLGRLPTHRLQRLQSTPVALLQKRVGKWLAGGAEAIFEQRCQDLRRHMQKHNQLPSRSSPDPETRKLGNWLRNLRATSPRSRVKEINALTAVHPLVKQLLQFDRHPVKITKVLWYKRLEELSFDERDAAFMQRLRSLAHEALSWPHLNGQQRLMWATVLELDVVPVQEPYPSFWRLVASGAASSTGIQDDATPSDPPLRKCQQDCLEACAKGARKIEMACGTGKTRIMKELVGNVLITVPLRALLDQIAADFPGFCKVGTRHNEKINFDANGFLAVSKSAHFLQKLRFDAVFVDEAHHPLPPKLPKGKELFQFSATLEEEKGIDFQYTMGKAIEDGVLCDYDITVPAVTAHHAYVCLADLLLKQAGRFRRVLAYCNSVAEAKRFQMVLKELGLAAWHINGMTGWKERKRVMDGFTGVLKKPVHVLVTVEVLGEGINIPNADTCMFVEPRNSYRSIIQAIGRILRHHPAKPLGHIILPAVAVPKRGPAQVPVPPSSEESKKQTKNKQTTHVSPSLAELPGGPGGEGHSADISLFGRRKDVTGKTAQGAETMGNGPVRGRELLFAPQEHQPSSNQRQGSVSSKQGRTKHKQGTMTAGSLAGAAAQSQMLPESRAIGPSSQTNPLATSGGQSVGRSQEGGRMRSRTRTAEMNSGPQNHKTLDGKELEINATDKGRMGIRYKRVRLQSLEGVGSAAGEYQSQLDRFLTKLMQADERLIGSSAGHWIQVVDCRIGVAGEVGMDVATNAIYGRLTALLMQTDPWEVRFESLEEFVRLYQRFPRKLSKDSLEATLGHWWSNQRRLLNLGRLSAHRLPSLQSTSVALIQQRVRKWMAGSTDAIFKQKFQDLRRHMKKNNKLPSRSSPDPEIRKLGKWLRDLRSAAPQSRVKEIKALTAVHPSVKQLLQFDRHPLKIKERTWYKRLEELSTFVYQHGRLPKTHATSELERRGYRWLWLQ
eukprot:symbB.v1.2.004024.t1/scaffold227.1/size261201/10